MMKTPHPFNRRVQIHDIEYASVRIASAATGIPYNTILYRLQNPNSGDYTYVSEQHPNRGGRRVVVGDEFFETITECALHYEISVHAVKYRISSDNRAFVGWLWYDDSTMTTVDEH